MRHEITNSPTYLVSGKIGFYNPVVHSLQENWRLTAEAFLFSIARDQSDYTNRLISFINKILGNMAVL